MKKNYYILTLSALVALVAPAGFAEARLVYSTEADGVHAPEFYLNQDDTSDDFVDLNFGTASGAQMRYDVVNNKFFLNRELDLENQILSDFRLEALSTAPVTCNASNVGYVYYDTAVTALMVCNEDSPAAGTYSFNSVEDLGTGSITTTEIFDGTITFADLNNTDITLADFTNDAGFITTDTDTTYTAGTGITLTGTVFSNDLGTSIDTAEIGDDQVTVAKIGGAGNNQVLTSDGSGNPQWEDKSIFATAAQGVLAASALQSGDNVSELSNDAGYLTAEVDGSITNEIQDLSLAGDTLSLTGDGTTVDLSGYTNTDNQDLALAGNTLSLTNDGTTVDLSGYLDNTDAQDLSLSGNTLSLTNDGTTVDLSAYLDDTNTTYTGSGGVTLTGTNFTADLGTSIDSSEIDLDTIVADDIATGAVETTEILDGTVAQADLNLTDITLADFTNDAGFVTTDTDTTYTGSGGVTLTGTNFTADLGTDIQTAEIGDDQVTVAKIGGAGNNQVLTSDGSGNPQWEDKSNFATSSLTTNNIFVGVGGVATDTAVSGDLSMIGGNFSLASNSVQDAEIDYSAVTLSDFTNDAGYITTDTDTTYTAGTGITLTGTVFSNDFGTDIGIAEMANGGNNQVLTTTGAGVPQWEDKAIFATAAQGALAASALQSGDNVSELSNDAGYLTAEVDGSITNEIQDLSLSGTTLSLSGDATDVDLSGFALTSNLATVATSGDYADLANLPTLGTAADNAEGDFATAAQGVLAASALQSGDNVSALTNDAGYITTDTNTTYTGSGGITLTGTNFTADLGTSVDATEIDTNAVNDDEINYANVTLADFTNDAGFITTDTDTTYTAGTGITLTGTTFSNDLGTDIATGEIEDGTITFADLNNTDITLSDFTNDLALSAGNIFVGNVFGVATGVAPSGDVSISGSGAFTIQDNSVDGTDIALGGDTAGDTMYYNGTNWVRLGIGTAGQVLQTNAGATAPEWATAAATDSIQDADGNTQIQVEEGSNDDTIRFDTNGGERMIIEADGDILIGATAETIANASFAMNGNDVFMADSLGVEGAIYTDATATKYETIDIFGCVRGSASAGTVAGGNSAVVRFDGNNNSQMRCSFAVPDDWVAGTDINIETFYSPSDNTAGDVRFNLRHAAKAAGEVIATGDFTDTVAGAVTIAASTELQMYELVEDIPAAGLALDDMVNINLRRAPGDAADTYAGDINIHMIRIAYTGKRLE